MSKPDSRGNPLAGPPSPIVNPRNARCVHVHHPPPGDPPDVDAHGIAVVDVVVDHRREQVVRAGDGVEITRKMQVDVLHRHDLRVAAAGGTTLHAEAGAERRLTQAETIERLPRRQSASLRPTLVVVLPPPAGGGLHRGDEDEPAIRAILQRAQVGVGDLRLVASVAFEVFPADAERGTDVNDGFQDRFAAISRSGFMVERKRNSFERS